MEIKERAEGVQTDMQIVCDFQHILEIAKTSSQHCQSVPVFAKNARENFEKLFSIATYKIYHQNCSLKSLQNSPGIPHTAT
jgi:DNA-binding transcriptional regulator WhiA